MNLGIKPWILVSVLIFGLPLFPQVSSQEDFRVENITVTIIDIADATGKVSFALELANQPEALATYEGFSEPDQERIAKKAVADCEFIIKKEFSDFIKTAYANCIADKTKIEIMNSPNLKDYIGWGIGIVGTLIGVSGIIYGHNKSRKHKPNHSL